MGVRVTSFAPIDDQYQFHAHRSTHGHSASRNYGLTQLPPNKENSMQQAVQNTSALERNITVSIPVDHLEAEIAQRLKKLARPVKMQGFRPGHVPIKMVERHYGFQVRQEVVTDEVQQRFADAVKDQNYRVAGYPRFQPVPSSEGASNVEYTATFEVYPDVQLGDLSKFEVTRPSTEVTEADVDKTILTLRKQRAKFNNVDREAKNG